MKKIILPLLLSGCLLLSLAACGTQASSGEEQTTGVTEDALHEISRQEMLKATGLDLPAPEGAENVSYHVLCASQEFPIAEMDFTLNGESAYLRAQSTDFIPKEPDAGASLKELDEYLDVADYDISGLFFTPELVTSTDIGEYCSGVCWTGEGCGVLAWVDVAPGVLYNLCMGENAAEETLHTLAAAAFVPLQGDADSDAPAA